jgi:hypothetical protein
MTFISVRGSIFENHSVIGSLLHTNQDEEFWLNSIFILSFDRLVYHTP